MGNGRHRQRLLAGLLAAGIGGISAFAGQWQTVAGQAASAVSSEPAVYNTKPSEITDFQYAIMESAVGSLVSQDYFEIGEKNKATTPSAYSKQYLSRIFYSILNYQGRWHKYPFEFVGTDSYSQNYFKKDSTIKRFNDMYGTDLSESSIKQNHRNITFTQDRITYSGADGEGVGLNRPMSPQQFVVYNDGSCGILWNYVFEKEFYEPGESGIAKTGTVSAIFTKNPDSFFGYTLAEYEIH